jgi:hypothetical protein
MKPTNLVVRMKPTKLSSENETHKNKYWEWNPQSLVVIMKPTKLSSEIGTHKD